MLGDIVLGGTAVLGGRCAGGTLCWGDAVLAGCCDQVQRNPKTESPDPAGRGLPSADV